MRAVAELPAVVASPALHVTVREARARVRVPHGDLRGTRDVGGAGACAIVGGSVAELRELARAPAAHRAVCECGAGRVATCGDGDGRARGRSRDGGRTGGRSRRRSGRARQCDQDGRRAIFVRAVAELGEVVLAPAHEAPVRIRVARASDARACRPHVDRELLDARHAELPRQRLHARRRAIREERDVERLSPAARGLIGERRAREARSERERRGTDEALHGRRRPAALRGAVTQLPVVVPSPAAHRAVRHARARVVVADGDLLRAGELGHHRGCLRERLRSPPHAEELVLRPALHRTALHARASGGHRAGALHEVDRSAQARHLDRLRDPRERLRPHVRRPLALLHDRADLLERLAPEQNGAVRATREQPRALARDLHDVLESRDLRHGVPPRASIVRLGRGLSEGEPPAPHGPVLLERARARAARIHVGDAREAHDRLRHHAALAALIAELPRVAVAPAPHLSRGGGDAARMPHRDLHGRDLRLRWR